MYKYDETVLIAISSFFSFCFLFDLTDLLIVTNIVLL